MSELNEQLPTLDWIAEKVNSFTRPSLPAHHEAARRCARVILTAFEKAIEARRAAPAPQAAPSDETKPWSAATIAELASAFGMGPRNAKAFAAKLISEIPRVAPAVTQAAPSEPVAWMRTNGLDCTSAAGKRSMEAANFGYWPELVKEYSIPLYAAPASPQQAQADARDAIIRDVCELDYSGEEFDHEDMLSVSRADLRLIVERHLAAATTSTAGR